MRCFLLSIILLVTSNILYAQENPPISKITGIKEKLVLIKKGFPLIRKNLVKKDPDDPEELLPKVDIGDYTADYEEDEGQEILKYRFSISSHSGSIEDFQAFYQKLLVLLTEVFGDKYVLSELPAKEKQWSASYYDKGLKVKSHTSIYIVCNWALPRSGPSVNLTFFGPAPKSE